MEKLCFLRQLNNWRLVLVGFLPSLAAYETGAPWRGAMDCDQSLGQAGQAG